MVILAQVRRVILCRLVDLAKKKLERKFDKKFAVVFRAINLLLDGPQKPVYVKGVRGAMERNAVRYYLALLADMDTKKYPETGRFDKRINEWFSLTERYPRQLHELDREEYLAAKRREHSNQLKLQEGLESK